MLNPNDNNNLRYDLPQPRRFDPINFEILPHLEPAKADWWPVAFLVVGIATLFALAAKWMR